MQNFTTIISVFIILLSFDVAEANDFKKDFLRFCGNEQLRYRNAFPFGVYEQLEAREPASGLSIGYRGVWDTRGTQQNVCLSIVTQLGDPTEATRKFLAGTLNLETRTPDILILGNEKYTACCRPGKISKLDGTIDSIESVAQLDMEIDTQRQAGLVLHGGKDLISTIAKRSSSKVSDFNRDHDYMGTKVAKVSMTFQPVGYSTPAECIAYYDLAWGYCRFYEVIYSNARLRCSFDYDWIDGKPFLSHVKRMESRNAGPNKVAEIYLRFVDSAHRPDKEQFYLSFHGFPEPKDESNRPQSYWSSLSILAAGMLFIATSLVLRRRFL
ncbi:MAG: hypothetical protein NTU79_14665 [Planctomycetota bacterium]|nr:hypothetical protein [Planctomycetota bacterium]